MQVVYIDEYQPSQASLMLEDSIYKVSQDNENIRVGKLAVPSPLVYLLPILAVGGLVALYWIAKKS